MKDLFGRSLALIFLIWAFPAFGADIRLEQSEDIDWIFISGEIESRDVEHFQRLAIGSAAAAVVLESPGGELEPALKIGEIIRLKEFGTVVPDGVTCVSSCALIWVAGKSRFLGFNSRVGFHASYVFQDGRQQETGLGNAMVGRYLTLLNLPERAIIFATSASPSELRWIDPSNPTESGIEFSVLPRSSVASANADSTRQESGGSDRASAAGLAEFHWKNDQWTVETNSGRTACSMMAYFTTEKGVENESLLLFGRDKGDDRLLVAFANEKFRSVREGETYDIEMIFETDGELDMGWGTSEFTAFNLDNGSRGLAAYFNGAELGQDVREEKTINFFYGDELIDGYPLTGSAAAFAQLIKCLGEDGKLADPFLRR